jgi:hypothetical protein
VTWEATLNAAMSVVRDTFPQTVTYTPEGGSPESVTGVFDAAYEGTEIDGDGLPVITSRPMLWLKLVDMSQAPHARDQAVIGSTTYEVTNTEIDGSGGIRLMLVEV